MKTSFQMRMIAAAILGFVLAHALPETHAREVGGRGHGHGGRCGIGKAGGRHGHGHCGHGRHGHGGHGHPGHHGTPYSVKKPELVSGPGFVFNGWNGGPMPFSFSGKSKNDVPKP